MRSEFEFLEFLGYVTLQVPVGFARGQIGDVDLFDDDGRAEELQLRVDLRFEINGFGCGDNGVLFDGLVLGSVAAEFCSGCGEGRRGWKCVNKL